MTREEAIECLNYQNEEFFGGQSEALKMAVSALAENDDVKEPKNGERFSCPNCGFKADWYIPDSAENKGDLINRQAVEEINSEIPKIHELFDIAYEYNQKDSTRTELSQKCTTYLLDVWQTLGAIVDNYSSAENKGDSVSRAAYEQTMWERDVAIQQLQDLGYGLGEKPRDNEGE